MASGKQALAGDQPDPGTHHLNHRHQRIGERHRSEHVEAKLGTGLGIGRNATGIVVAAPVTKPGPSLVNGWDRRRCHQPGRLFSSFPSDHSHPTFDHVGSGLIDLVEDPWGVVADKWTALARPSSAPPGG
jgi:hypothetical protein